MAEPLVVHGLDLSYFTGKLEGYLRAKGIEYRLEEMTTGSFRALARNTGVAQMPQLQMPDGAWLTDTPRIIDTLEERHPDPTVTPTDPAARYIAHLLEDYGDEWLWRPALYYRWAFADDARLMSGRLARGMLRDVPAPYWLRRHIILRRQQGRYLRSDGVTARTAPAIARLYLSTLDVLETALEARPFLQGERPTRADFGFFGSMFRHFASDPTPAALMRARAPRTWAWVARIWALTPAHYAQATLPAGAPSRLEPLAAQIAGPFLGYMERNAQACARGDASVQWEDDGALFEAPTNPYRAWRLDRSRQMFAALPEPARAAVRSWLGARATATLSQPAAGLEPPAAGGRPRDREWRPR